MMTAEQLATIKPGDVLVYNDGRIGHSGVKAVVLALGYRGAHVQFEDRADETFIPFEKPEWTAHLALRKGGAK